MMRVLSPTVVLLPLATAAALCALGAAVLCPAVAALAKDKPLGWKPIEDALLRVNDAAPKEWGVYRTGKKNDPLVLQVGNRFLLIQSHDHQVFELEATKIERKSGELLWAPANRPAKPLATSDWMVDDIGAAFVIKVKLSNEDAVVDLQLPHPPEIGNLPQQAPSQRPHRDYFSREK